LNKGREPAFVTKSFDEGAVPQFINYFGGDTAGQVYSTPRQNFERQVSGFCSVNGSKQVERSHTGSVSAGNGMPGYNGRGVLSLHLGSDAQILRLNPGLDQALVYSNKSGA
jgi:hypothetical protein